MSVHNIKHEPMRSGDVYVGRFTRRHHPNTIDTCDGYFGNPFVIRGNPADRETAVRDFELYARDRIASDPEYRDRVRALAGKRLFCWCAPLPCHGEVLEQLAGELADWEYHP